MQTIMVVDDETAVRCSLKAILERRFSVVTCAGGPEAIKFASDHPRQVYAAFVDYGMPAMDGNLVCAALRELDPTIALVGFSGNENAPFQGPLVATLSKRRLSAKHVLELAVTAVRAAAHLRKCGPPAVRASTD